MKDDITKNDIPDFIEERDLFGQTIPKTTFTKTIDYNQHQEKVELSVEYAGLGLRILAYILDAVILTIPLIIFYGFLFGANWASIEYSFERNLLGSFLYILYYGITESSDNQATFGKRICGLMVIDERGNKLSFSKAAFRYIAQLISILPLGFGIWSIARDEKKQAWHDMLLACYVIVKKDVDEKE